MSHPHLIDIPSPFPLENWRLRLLEPAESCASELSGRLLDGTYDKPFILDCGELRFLHFDFDNIQSAMRHDDPYALCLAYTRKMMAFLLFHPEPHRILLLGLGGGSLAKFCYRHLPASTITTIEIDPNVMALREVFGVPADSERFRVLLGDGVEYVARRGERKDAILVDACDRDGIAPALNAPHFYSAARLRLKLGGVFVMNICGDNYERAAHIARIRGAFGNHVITLPVSERGNLIVLAFRSQAPADDSTQLLRQAHALQRRYGLNFPRYVRKMAHAFRTGRRVVSESNRRS